MAVQSIVHIEAQAFRPDEFVPVFKMKHSRWLCGLFGPVGEGVPIVIRFRGPKRHALNIANVLRDAGYRRVRVLRMKRSQEKATNMEITNPCVQATAEPERLPDPHVGCFEPPPRSTC